MTCDNCPFRCGNPCTSDAEACGRHADMEYAEEMKSQVEYWKRKYLEVK